VSAGEREFAQLSETRAGDWIEAGEGFDCLPPKSRREVHFDRQEGLHYVWCRCGRHALQADPEDRLIGMYRIIESWR
jgi:hypothetical protein